MKLAGKCPPDPDEIRRLDEAGFDYFELYLSTDILDEHSHNEIVDICRGAPIDAANVHTPHIDIDEDTTAYYRRTDRIAEALDATLVLDSNPVSTRYMPDVYPSDEVLAPRHGYENDPGMSAYYLRNTHLEAKGEPLVLDTAHFRMSEADVLPFLRIAIGEYGTERIPAVHLDTATPTEDGRRPLDGGDVPVGEVIRNLDGHGYEGTVVLEVPDEYQPEALELAEQALSL